MKLDKENQYFMYIGRRNVHSLVREPLPTNSVTIHIKPPTPGKKQKENSLEGRRNYSRRLVCFFRMY